MTLAKGTRRISVDVPENIYIAINEHFVHGDKNQIYEWFTRELLRLFNEFGYGKVLGACLTRSIKLEELVKLELGEGSAT